MINLRPAFTELKIPSLKKISLSLLFPLNFIHKIHQLTNTFIILLFK